MPIYYRTVLGRLVTSRTRELAHQILSWLYDHHRECGHGCGLLEDTLFGQANLSSKSQVREALAWLVKNGYVVIGDLEEYIITQKGTQFAVGQETTDFCSTCGK